MSEWTDSLQQASFKSVPFAVLNLSGRHGRDVALHEYPFRDKPWAEDLGRATRGFPVTGFLITDSAVYGGGDVKSQLQALIAAVESPGPNTLVHPVLGELQVSIPKDGFSWDIRWDQGGYVEFTLQCIEGGDRQFPDASSATDDATDSAADEADDAASEDYDDALTGVDPSTGLGDVIHDGERVVSMVVSTAEAWVGKVLMYAADATSLFNMLVALPGNFGRYFAGRLAGFASLILQAVTGATVQSLITLGISRRASVAQACGRLITAAGGVDPRATAAACQATAQALLAATANPADAVRILSGLVNFSPALPTDPSVIGAAESIVQTATGALCRRAALTALARATALYQPSSADDAASLSTSVAALFDAEILVAGDAGEDASYQALRALRAAIIFDLATRGAALPSLVTVTSNAPMPSLVLAQRLYQDPTRADELVTEANPIHPAFMPISFSALGE